MKILTSAKINLNLKIHDGLQDNFHKIESDIIPVGIFDEIVIKESQKDQIIFNIDKLNDELTTIHKSLSIMRKCNPSFDKTFEIMYVISLSTQHECASPVPTMYRCWGVRRKG